ncbi:membrane protein, putative [Geobacter sulfurreducens KN400]|nr:membrane protein, putative [Geobacter sulfurreducens KN400]
MERDRRIDTIRGLLVAIMIIDHVGGYLKLVTAQTLGYVSAAEGFVFLSGFVCAKVYGRYLDNTRQLLTKTFRRSFLIYRYHIAVALLIPLLSILIPPYRRSWAETLHPYHLAPVKTVILDLFLLHEGDNLGILPLYVLLLLLCPLILILLRRTSMITVLIMSLSLWCVGQFYNPLHSFARLFGEQYDAGFFNILAWQFLFTLGLCISMSNFLIVKISKNRKAMAVLTVICLAFFILRHSGVEINHDLLINRSNLPIHRLTNFCFLLILLRHIIIKLPNSFRMAYLEFMGKNSLKVFSTHILVLYLCKPVAWRVESMFGNVGLTGVSILVFVLSTMPVSVYNKYRQSSFIIFRQNLNGSPH